MRGHLRLSNYRTVNPELEKDFRISGDGGIALRGEGGLRGFGLAIVFILLSLCLRETSAAN